MPQETVQQLLDKLKEKNAQILPYHQECTDNLNQLCESYLRLKLATQDLLFQLEREPKPNINHHLINSSLNLDNRFLLAFKNHKSIIKAANNLATEIESTLRS